MERRNASYNLAELRNCWIRNRTHLWGSDTTWYVEARYEDVSACNAPDLWKKYLEDKRSCRLLRAGPRGLRRRSRSSGAPTPCECRCRSAGRPPLRNR